MAFSWLPFGRLRASAADRAAALASRRIEDLHDPEGAPTLVTAGRETKAALPVHTPHFDAAIYSSRGRGYARYNEDGALLFPGENGHLYAAVFDQAGGLGGSVRGAASGLAALETFKAFRRIATGPDDVDVPHTLTEGVMRAHEALVARGEGEVTTAVILVARPDSVTLVTSGDSAALWFDRAGIARAATEKHEQMTPYGVGALTHAVGLEPERPAAQTYEWKIERGDWLIACSDGLLDSGLTDLDLGEVLRAEESAELAVNRLVKRVLRRMTLMRAKPDNLTVVALRVL